MLEIKDHHKELKRAVNEVEQKDKDRSNKSWYDLRNLIKTKCMDKLNATKQKLFEKNLLLLKQQIDMGLAII